MCDGKSNKYALDPSLRRTGKESSEWHEVSLWNF